MMRVLVTGGAGFIGSHTVEALLERGCQVRVLDSLEPPVHIGPLPEYTPAEVEFIHGSVTDRDALGKALHKMDAVFHLAAYQDYLTDFSRFFATNCVSTALLYEHIVNQRLPLQKVVIASSQAVYGEGKYRCIEHGFVYPEQRTSAQLDEGDWNVRCPVCNAQTEPDWTDESIVRPHNSYAMSKRAQEEVALALGRRYGIPTVALRYSIVQGPRQSFRNAYSGALRCFAVRILAGLPPVLYEDGEQLRDYVSVHDVVRANLLVLENAQADYQAFNVGGARRTTVRELAEMTLHEAGSSLEPVTPRLSRVGDTRHVFSDVSKLAALGWQPRVPQREIVREYVAWAANRPDVEDTVTPAQTRMQAVGVLRPVSRVLTHVVLLLLWLLADVRVGDTAAAVSGDPSVVGQWSAVQDWPSRATTASVLPTGDVLYWPSWADGIWTTLWDPAASTFVSSAMPGYDVFCAGNTFLGDGRLFVTGGHQTDFVGPPYASAYDPFTDSWTRVPDMNAGRWYPTNTTLSNGDVLVRSGTISTGVFNNLPQVWQAATGTWRDLTGAQTWAPLYPWMYLAPNGKTFYAGPSQGTYYLDTAGTGSIGTVWMTNFGDRSVQSYGSSVMYADGKVLITGGGDPPTATAEVIDLNAAAPAWRYVASMTNARKQHNATLLPDETVLVTGGHSGPGLDNSSYPVYDAELWNPSTETWLTLAANSVYRGYHATAFLLPDGRVVSAGSEIGGPNAEIFSPPYLFKGARPTISSAPASVSMGQTFFVGTPDSANIARVTLIRLASVTHAFDENQRVKRLSFTVAPGGLNVTAPLNANLAPPGYYMLFILNTNGVPSVAKFVRLGTSSSPPPATPTPTATPTRTPTPISTTTPTSTPTRTGIPAAPSNLAGTAISRSQISLTWLDNSNNEDGFKIERSNDGVTFAQVGVVGANVTTFSDSGLASNRNYTYRARSYNSVGNSAYSNTVKIKTPRF